MLFNSIDFAVFLPVVFFLYWIVCKNNIKAQNVLLLASSYLFYGWWNWSFLSLIFISSLLDFMVSIGLAKTDNNNFRKLLLGLSIVANLGLLGYFKYCNFFIESFNDAFTFFGADISIQSLKIVLPVGISFYTFQTLSYTIDVYRKSIKPTKDIVSFFSFVSFFPQLVAGPIERASNLLPQFFRERTFNYATAVMGMRQILWGFFKKMVIADNCAVFANEIFNNATDHNGSTLLLGALFFAFQIYGDFSGYSDIAIGVSKLFGFNLMQNFAFPYFSRDIAEFWRRWHISLSTWFRDYLYIPLGGSKGSRFKVVRNTFIVFLVSGFWHGANWTFVAWGLWHAIAFLPLLLLNKNRVNLNNISDQRVLPSLKEFGSIVSTFAIVVLGWIFFRAESLTESVFFFKSIFSTSLFTTPAFEGIDKAGIIGLLVLFFLTIEWFGRNSTFAIEKLDFLKSTFFRYSFYYGLIILIFIFGAKQEEFIYFQF